MQEDIENKTVMLAINTGKLSGRTLKSAIGKLLHQMMTKHHAHKDVIHHGKQTVKQLVEQNQGVSNIEINDPGIKEFERIARKYGVDFAVKKVKGDQPKYLVFFKARDADALTAAFKEYTDKRVIRDKRPSLRQLLKQMIDKVKQVPNKEKKKEISR